MIYYLGRSSRCSGLQPPRKGLLKFHQVCRKVLKRATVSIEVAHRNNWLADIAMDYLTLGRVYFLETQLKDGYDFSKVIDHLDRAVDGMRRAGHQNYIPRGLLARAALRRVQKQYREAWVDVEEVMEIAEQGSMRLFQADGLLESARLHWEEGDAEQARTCLEKAKKMIDEMGYHRRDREVEALEVELVER